jgi:hypothetical protein
VINAITVDITGAWEKKSSKFDKIKSSKVRPIPFNKEPILLMMAETELLMPVKGKAIPVTNHGRQ